MASHEKLLILDLDETLISAHETALEIPPDFTVCEIYHVYRRPYLNQFLEFCFSNYKVAVWTTASEDYAEQVVENIFPEPDGLQFIWARKRCTFRRNPERDYYYWIKDLKKVKRLGYSLDQVLFVDDDPVKIERHYGNHIPILSFTGSVDDRELFYLQMFLQQIKNVPNVRITEKRWWRKNIINEQQKKARGH
ncbi:HAD family hydrolase [candidate division KSB1 bacterium]|nr:HAD family hydrolase [candidate division KSB1 bacterium]